MLKDPAISVLIPVYNGGKTIAAAVWSILNQSFPDFELLIYLDGCKDTSKTELLAISDERIRLFESEENLGIVHARNFLISKARATYIAWLDADDLALPGRLQKQYDFMQQHAEILILGSWCKVRNSNEIASVQWPADRKLLQAWMLFRNPLVQSSVMLRRSILDSPLLQDFEYVEDYEFYCRFTDKPCFYILPEFLCSYYNATDNELLNKHRNYSFVKKSLALMKNNLEVLGFLPAQKELELLHHFIRTNARPTKEDAASIFRVLLAIHAANSVKKRFDKSAFNLLIHYQLLRLLRQCPAFRPRLMQYLLGHPAMMLKALRAGPRYGG